MWSENLTNGIVSGDKEEITVQYFLQLLLMQLFQQNSDVVSSAPSQVE